MLFCNCFGFSLVLLCFDLGVIKLDFLVSYFLVLGIGVYCLGIEFIGFWFYGLL